jgi:hypothetical protein
MRQLLVLASEVAPSGGGLWRVGSVVFEPRSAIAIVRGGGTSNDLAAATLAAEGVFMCKAAGEDRGESPDLPIQRPICRHRHPVPEPHPGGAHGRLVRHRHIALGVGARRRSCHPSIMGLKSPVLLSPDRWFTLRVHPAVAKKLRPTTGVQRVPRAECAPLGRSSRASMTPEACLDTGSLPDDSSPNSGCQCGSLNP